MRRGEAFELGGGEGDCADGADTIGDIYDVISGYHVQTIAFLQRYGITMTAAQSQKLTAAFQQVQHAQGGDGGDKYIAVQQAHQTAFAIWVAGIRRQPSAQEAAELQAHFARLDETLGATHSVLSEVASTFSDVVTFIAPFAETALSFVPGVGTVASFAIAAGVSLAEGNNISDALIAGTASALPGGPVVRAAFDVGVGIVKGESVSTIALNTARNNLPGGPAAVAAFDIAVSLAVGQQVQQGNLAAVETSGGSTTITIVPPAPVGPPPLLAPFLQRTKAQAMGVSIQSGPNRAVLELILTDKRKAELAAQKKARKVGAAVAGAGALGAAAWWFLL